MPDKQPAPQPVRPRRERYLVAPHTAVDADSVLSQLTADPAVSMHRVIRPGEPDGGARPAPFPTIAVVDMEADRAAALNANPMIHVEPDLPLSYTAAGSVCADPGVIPTGGETSVVFTVLGGDGKALEGAEVYLINDAFPVRGVTGADGTAVITVPPGVLPSLAGVYVKPRHDHWAIWLGRPHLSLDSPNLAMCPSLAETFPGFPERQIDGWGRRAMRFDSLPPTFRGHGVTIAIIDSGVSAEHPDLGGRVTGGKNTGDDGWRADTIGHGTHAAGLICGSDNGHGIVGVAPEATVHSYRIFPDGRFSDLIEALDRCILDRVDIVNLSVGSPQPSHLVAMKIEQARQAGIACVAAAGNAGGPVRFPATMPTVLAVAAVGRTGEYPPESYHATQVIGVPSRDGYFSAAFTCFGPEVDVCAPGVAIVSSVPPTNYAAWDGTSFAAPYVTGLAALMLAHHPELREPVIGRGARRVDRMFELIRASCRPLALGDPGRSGAGLPDAAMALGLVPAMPLAHPAEHGSSTTPPGVTLTAPSSDALDPLRAAMRAAGLLPVVPDPS
jgi:subtilisin family serine protease